MKPGRSASEYGEIEDELWYVGSAEPGHSVDVYLRNTTTGSTSTDQVIADGNGDWTYQPGLLTGGNYELYATQAGATNLVSATYYVSVNTSSPSSLTFHAAGSGQLGDQPFTTYQPWSGQGHPQTTGGDGSFGFTPRMAPIRSRDASPTAAPTSR